MSPSISLLGALGFGLFYWLVNYDTHFTNWAGNPMFQGMIWGLIYGNVHDSMVVASSIQLMYIVSVAVGANLPADQVLAGIVAIPIALMNDLPAEQAIMIAVPFAMVGSFIDNARRMINGLWNRRAHHCVDSLNLGGLRFCACVGPALVQLPLRVIPVAVIMFFGAGNSDVILQWLPVWLTNGFSVVGGMLPVLGMVSCVRLIGRKLLLPYFVIGFFIAKLASMPMLTMAVFAGMIAVIHVSILRSFNREEADEDDEEDENQLNTADNAQLQYATTPRDRRATCFKVLFMHRIGNCMEFFYGTGMAHCLVPVLKRLYGHDEERFKEALHRHLAPYICEMTWGNCIIGAVVAMEEQRANGAPIEGEAISTLKSSLMGSFAGLGDTLNYFIMSPIIRSVMISFGMQGMVVGCISQPLISAIVNTIGFITFPMGYRLGRDSLDAMLQGNWLETVMMGAGIVGMFMMGGMSANYVKVNTPVSFTIGAVSEPFVLQTMVDQILPGLLPFLLVCGAYLYLEKGGTTSKLMLILAVSGILLGALGILK